MQVIFKYDEDKDIDCLLSMGPGSNNQPGMETKTYSELLRFNPDIRNTSKVREFVRKYIKDRKLDILERATQLQEKWNKLNNEFEKRADSVFGVKISDSISAYLTITGRFPYNIEQNFFFVSAQWDNANSVVMHELWHFYTWQKFGKDGVNKLGAKKYNDFKEALTVLLNIECTDLMKGETDDGYPQHQDIRKVISKKWIETKNIDQVWESLKVSF